MMEALLDGIRQREQTGGFLTSCEAELQELMRQIDIMLTHKKSEWESQTNVLTARLELREQELSSVRATLEQKHKEVGVLRQQMEDLEQDKHSLATEYEQQLARFQQELAKLKRSYEKLQRKQLKEAREGARSTGEDRSEVNRLTRKIEEFRLKSLDWEKQRLLYQQQVSSLEMQRKTLGEQSELIQQQSQNYLSQLTSRKQMLEQVELANQSEIQHLSSQLQRANDTVCAKELEAERLSMRLEELSGVNRRLLEEQQRTQEELRHSCKLLEVLQVEKVELKATLQSQENVLQNSQSQREQIQKELARVKENLQSKELSIRSLEERLQEKLGSDCTLHVQADLEMAVSQLELSRRSEQGLRAEVSRLDVSLESANAKCLQLSRELTEKQEELQRVEEQHNMCKSDIRKLKEQLSQTEQKYKGSLEGMKKEITQLTQELHQRDITFASVSSSTSDMDRRLRGEMERAERKAAENRVIEVQLETLRLENRHLLEILQKVETGVFGVDDIPLTNLRESYIKAQNNLERDNQHLQKELAETQAKLEVSTQACQEKYESVVRQTQSKLSELQSADHRRSLELQQKHEMEMKALQAKLQERIKQYEGEIRTLKSQRPEVVTEQVHCTAAANPLSRNSSFESLCSEFLPEVKSVSPDVDGNEADFSDNGSTSSEPGKLIPLQPPPDSPVGSIATRFLDEEELRSQRLLEQLDSHIEELKRESQKTLDHFSHPK